MTKKKKTFEGPYSPLELNQYRLRKIAADLEDGVELPPEESRFLINALQRIGTGEDANAVLGVKAKPGERKTSGQASRTFNMQLAITWIATKIDGGSGKKLPDAIEEAAKRFRLKVGTLENYWSHHPELHEGSFPRPISTFPDRKPKTE